MSAQQILEAESTHPLLAGLAIRGDRQQRMIADVARALRGAAQEPSSPATGHAAVDSAVDDVMVHRRSLPILTTQFPESLPAWAAGLLAERRIGPITDEFGRDVWFDLFRRVRQARFVRSASDAPFLAMPISQVLGLLAPTTGSTHTSLDIAAGSVWFATRLLSPAAPSNVYTGLRISGGSIRFGQPVTWNGDAILVPAHVPCEIQLNLEVPSPTSGNGPGRDARAATFRPPLRAVLAIGPGGATLTVSDRPSLQVYDFASELEPIPGPATYLPSLNRVTIPLRAQQTAFAVGVPQSSLFLPEGTCSVSDAAWALPAASIDPANLGEASGVGALMLELSTGLTARWTGLTRPVSLGRTRLLLDHERLLTVSEDVRGYDVALRPQLPEAAGRAHLRFTWNSSFPVSFVSQASGTETLVTTAAFDASMELPVDVNGEPIAVRAPGVAVALIESAQDKFFWVQGNIVPTPVSPGLAFGMTNAVLRASLPRSVVCIGSFDGTATEGGSLGIGYDLFGILATLPDPYAASATLDGIGRRASRGRLLTTLAWSSADVKLTFALPSGAAVDMGSAIASAPSPEAAVASPLGRSTLASGGPLDGMMTFVLGARPRFDPNAEIEPARKALGNSLDFERQSKVVLVDVSTSASQFGVALRQLTRARLASAADELKPLTFQGLDLSADARTVVLLTLPAVQWEPVHAEPVVDDPMFPPHLSFANSGVPTVLSVPTVELVPVRPTAAYEAIADNFATPAPLPAEARFTLPFGLIAKALLKASDPAQPRGARVTQSRPSAGELVGAHQLKIESVDPSLPTGETPSLQGFAVQLPVAIPSDGSPGPRSILGTSVSNIFNDYLGAAGIAPQVPITRIDLSGFGESLLSRWANPTLDETQVSKAEFHVLIGRTAFEVVQVRSILLPYAVPVVRTITLTRKNNAAIVRHDSGWVAVADGTYRFADDIVTHPGVVRRITAVDHIRETGQRIIQDGVEFAAAYYHGDLIIDGATGPVPVTRHFGFVKIGTQPLTASVYAGLLARTGPLCGPLDVTINVGGGPQRMRLHRVGVGVTASASGPEFVMAAWGGLSFPGGGDWSVLQADDAAGAPGLVRPDTGLPLIRAGAAGGPPPTSPYRFADPEDLAHEGAPARDYGILHATGTQRALFRRPKIEAGDLSRIVSTERPLIADPYVLATGHGPFPKQSDAIPFPASPWALAVDGGGAYRLEMPATTFPAGVGRRTMRQAGTVKSDLDYSASMVTYELDTAQAVPWRFGLTRARKVMSNTSMGDLVSLTADVVAAADRATTFDNPKLELGGALSIVEDLLTILADLGIVGTLSTEMTNKWSLKAALAVPFADAAGDDLQIPPGVPLPTIKFFDTGLKLEIEVKPDIDAVTFELGGAPMFAVKSFPGLYVAAVLKFTLELSTKTGTTYGVLIGFGFATDVKVGPFGTKTLVAVTFFAVFGDNLLGYGAGFLIKLALAYGVFISIELSLEGKLARVIVHKSLPDETVFTVGKLVFAIDVCVFLVLSITLEHESKCVNVLRGPLGEDALPDVI